MRILGKYRRNLYFIDYSDRDIDIGETFKYKDTDVKICAVYDQFLDKIDRIPKGWKTIVELETTHTDFDEVLITGGWLNIKDALEVYEQN